MAPGKLLERNVQPARGPAYVDEDDIENFSDEVAGESEYGSESGSPANSEEHDSPLNEDAGSVVESEEDEAAGHEITNVSFGSLKKAQDALVKKRKREPDTATEQDEKLDALRTRLKRIKEAKGRTGSVQPTKQPQRSSKFVTVAATAAAQDMGSDSDSAPSEVGGTKSRTSKHAPTSRSSRYQITRKRNVVDVPKRISRDPRFDAFNQNSSDPGNVQKAYSFLRDYQNDEIAELKAAVRQAKTEDDRETLKRKLISMQNRIKTDDAKEREQNILRQHRKEEKQRVEEGKKPFFLKRKEVKDRALVEKFKGMKGKDREKLVERRRRKDDQREKKKMPEARRVV